MKYLPIIDTALMAFLVLLLIYIYTEEKKGHKEMMQVLNQIKDK